MAHIYDINSLSGNLLSYVYIKLIQNVSRVKINLRALTRDKRRVIVLYAQLMPNVGLTANVFNVRDSGEDSYY